MGASGDGGGRLAGLAGLALVLAALVLAANYWLVRTSSIASVDELRYELSGLDPQQATSTWRDDWLWRQPAPFKYRLLGKLPLWAASEALQRAGLDPDRAFHHAFVACLFLFLFLTLLQLGAFTRALAAEVCGPLPPARQLRVAGVAMVLFVLSPPVLFLCKYPVHGSPNDLLGYFLMLAALHLGWRGRVAAACAVSTLAVFCRETTLLVPFALLFFRHVPLPARLGAALLPVAAFLAYRALWPGSYDALAGARANFALPLETLGFTLLVFGPLWILGPLGWRELAHSTAGRAPALAALLRSFIPAAALVLGVTLLLGRMREIRIAAVLFVYVVPLSALWLYRCRVSLLRLLRSRYYLLWGLAAAAAVFRLRVWLLPRGAGDYATLASKLGVLFTGYTNTPQYNWMVISMVYLWLSLLALPLALPVGKNAVPARP